MELIIIVIIEIVKYAMLIGAVTSILYMIANSSENRLSLITGGLIYIILFVILPKHIPYSWTRLEFITSGILASVISVIIGNFILGIISTNTSLQKGFIFNWAIYSTQVGIFYLNNPNKPIFDYPNGPTIMKEFWSFFTWSFLEANNLILTLGCGLITLEITKYFMKRLKILSAKKCTDIT